MKLPSTFTISTVRQRLNLQSKPPFRLFLSNTWIHIFFLLILVGELPQSAQAFRPPDLSQELGCSPTLSLIFGSSKNPQLFFDPLELSNDLNFARLREAELKHGRVAMLAVLETMVVPFLRTKELKGGFLPSILHTSWADYLKVIITCGVLEILILVQRDVQGMPGDYGIGYFGLRDKGLNEAKLIKELENSRLAMIAAAIQVFNEVVTGESWDEQWFGYFKVWVQQFL